MTTIHVRTSHGMVHALTIGRQYKDDGRPGVNSVDSAIGKADCNALTSAVADITDAPVTCARCIERDALRR